LIDLKASSAGLRRFGAIARDLNSRRSRNDCQSGFGFHFEFHRAGKIGKPTPSDETGRQIAFDATG